MSTVTSPSIAAAPTALITGLGRMWRCEVRLCDDGISAGLKRLGAEAKPPDDCLLADETSLCDVRLVRIVARELSGRDLAVAAHGVLRAVLPEARRCVRPARSLAGMEAISVSVLDGETWQQVAVCSLVSPPVLVAAGLDVTRFSALEIAADETALATVRD